MADRNGDARGGLGARLGPDFPLRAAAAVVLMAGALALAWAGGFPFLLFWFVAAAGVTFEWQRLVGGERVILRSAAGALALFIASVLAMHSYGGGAPAIVAALAGAGAVGALAGAGAGRRFEAGAGVVYAGVLAVGANLLRASPEYGFAAMLWLFAVVWGTDVMAYMGGRLIGGPRLWPSVSPGKTWSGAIVGALFGAALGVVFAFFTAPNPVKLEPMAILGLAASIAAQAGDLFESAMKRRSGVKDSGHLIPGHGGLMDRLDGFVVALALATAVAFARSPEHWIAAGLFEW